MDEPTQDDEPSGEQLPETPVAKPGDGPPVTAEREHKFKNTWKLVAGFLGWYAVMALIYFAPTAVNDFFLCIGPFMFVQVVAFSVLLSKPKTKYIGWGMISAIAINLLISLILGLVYNAVCFVPFFRSME